MFIKSLAPLSLPLSKNKGGFWVLCFETPSLISLKSMIVIVQCYWCGPPKLLFVYQQPICITLKSIFHWKLGSHWPPNANKINTKYMKCTWPTLAPRVGDPTHLYSTWSCKGLAFGVMQILAFALGVTQILAFLDTNMLGSQREILGLGV